MFSGVTVFAFTKPFWGTITVVGTKRPLDVIRDDDFGTVVVVDGIIDSRLSTIIVLAFLYLFYGSITIVGACIVTC